MVDNGLSGNFTNAMAHILERISLDFGRNCANQEGWLGQWCGGLQATLVSFFIGIKETQGLVLSAIWPTFSTSSIL